MVCLNFSCLKRRQNPNRPKKTVPVSVPVQTQPKSLPVSIPVQSQPKSVPVQSQPVPVQNQPVSASIQVPLQSKPVSVPEQNQLESESVPVQNQPVPVAVPVQNQPVSESVPVPVQSQPVPVAVPAQNEPRLSNMSKESSVSSLGEKKNKFLCSFGGKIIPRYSDGQLVYAGGDTRVIAIPRSITFSELKKKIEETYKKTRLVIKYRISPEDLDALVSVTSDEDLIYMWEEHDKLASQNREPNSTPRMLRLFLFQKSPRSIPPQIQIPQNYLDAINCRPIKAEAASNFHRVMSTPNLTCGTHCCQSQRLSAADNPIARRGSYQNLRNANGSKMAQNPVPNTGGFGSLYWKYEAGPSTAPAGKPQSRTGTPVRRPIIWD